MEGVPGGVPQVFGRCSGRLCGIPVEAGGVLEVFRRHSATVPGVFRRCSGRLCGIPGGVPEVFREAVRYGGIPEVFRKAVGHVPGGCAVFLEVFRRYFRRYSGGVPGGCAVFREVFRRSSGVPEKILEVCWRCSGCILQLFRKYSGGVPVCTGNINC